MSTDLTEFLTPKQQKFCDEYLTDLNATRAALRAGYSSSTALGGALMRIPKIAAYIQQHTEAAAQKAQVSREMVLTELAKVAFGNMRNYFKQDGTMKTMNELSDDEAAALWSVTVSDSTAGGTVRIKMNNKMAALEKIAKHIGFYYTEPEVPGKEYVVIEKDKLTVNDRFEDDSFADEEEENEWDDEFADETEQERIDRMEDERYKLVYFYPKLDEVLPAGRYLTDAVITQALQQLTSPVHDEPWWLADMRNRFPATAALKVNEEGEIVQQESGTMAYVEVPEVQTVRRKINGVSVERLRNPDRYR